METCKVCNEQFRSLGSLQMHLSKSHNFTNLQLKEYYDSFYKKETEGLDPFTGGKTKFIGLTKGYSRFDGSPESNRKKIASSTLEYWVVVKGYTIDEARKYLSDKHNRSSKNANETKKKLLQENPDRKYLGGYGKKKWELMGYSSEEAQRKYEEVKSNREPKLKESLSKVNWDGKRKGQIQYWIKKGFSQDEAKIKVKESQTTFTLDKCIKKYGKEKGTLVYNDRQEHWKKSLQENFEREGDGRSYSSKFANSIITELCSYFNIEIPKKEKWIKDKKTGNAYSYDFTYGKKIIEFNGDYWHCNPHIYEADYFNKNKGLTAEKIWKYDDEKIKLAKLKGYQVLVIWESEWLKDPKQIIEKCIKFINTK
jgi:hypothetical protein